MNKLFTKIAAATLGVAMAIGVGVAVSHSGVAKEAMAEGISITFPGSPSKYTNSYSSSFTITNSNVDFTFANWNNGQESDAWSAIRGGSKKNAWTGTITSGQISKAVTSVDVVVSSTTTAGGGVSSLVVATDSSFTQNVQQIDKAADSTTGTKTYTIPTPTANCYYKLTHNAAKGSNNGEFRITGVNFTYKANDPTISFSPSSLSLITGQSASTVQAAASNIGDNIEYLWGIKTGEDAEVVSLTGDETATVSVTPLKAGTTVLECYAAGSAGNVTGYVNVSVSLAPTSVTFNDTDPAASTYTLSTYDSYSYKTMPAVTVAPEGVSQDVTYTVTSGSDLVSVNDAGTRVNILKEVSTTETATIKIASALDEDVYATLTVSVAHDPISAIRVKDGATIKTQYIGNTFDPSGIDFQKRHTNNSTWVNFDEGDSVFSETEITSETTTARVYLTGSNKTIYCDVTGFTVTEEPNYTGTYNIVSNHTSWTSATITEALFKEYTDNSALFTIAPVNIKFGASPKSGSGDVGGTSDISFSAANASLTFTAPDGYLVTRVATSVSAKGTESANLTINGYTYSDIENDSRSLIIEYPFTSSFAMSSTSSWLYIEYINISIVKSNSLSDIALAYGVAFNELTNDECEAMAGISDDTWGYVEDYYDAAVLANAGLENELKTAQANKAGNELGQAMFRYDMIVAKYSKSDFLKRTGGSSGLNHVQSINNSANVAIVIIVASISFVSLGAFLVLKKRKEQ